MGDGFRAKSGNRDIHFRFALEQIEAIEAQKKKEERERQWHLKQALKKFHEPTEEELIKEAKKRKHWEEQSTYERNLWQLDMKKMKLQKERDDAQDRKWREIRNKKFEKEQQYDVGECKVEFDKEKWALATLDIKENELCDQETVMNKYNELMVKYNPARNPDDEISKAICRWVNEAYKFLSEKSNQREFSITTPSYFNFSSPPLGFQKNKYFVNVRP